MGVERLDDLPDCRMKDSLLYSTLVMIQKIGLLGYPLSHSISPAFQQAAIDHYSLPVQYGLWSIPPHGLDPEVKKLRGDAYLGANVTIPYKEQILALVDHVDITARNVGAVNTIVRNGRKLVGYNTDGWGFIKSLQDVKDFDLKGINVLMLGAGGAARAAAFALMEGGVGALTIANRTTRRSEVLAKDLGGLSKNVRAIQMCGGVFYSASMEAKLIVNCTSVGMKSGSDEGSTLLTSTMISPKALVYDMVYNPSQTPLMKEANKIGARTLGGLMMLIYQGAASFKLWTDKDAPIETMVHAGKEALSKVT